MLTDPQIERYARHVLLREVGGVGQERLLAARVAVRGLGPVGGWAVAYLALAGVGHLDLLDPAPVGRDELVPLLGPEALGRPRDRALAEAVAAYNPDVVARAVGAVEPGCAAVVVTDPAAGPVARGGEALLADPATGPVVPGGAHHAAAGTPVFAAFAAGDGAIAGPLGAACPACVARVLGEAGRPDPASALLAGSLAATLVLTRLATNAGPADGFLIGGGGNLRRLEPAAIACPHRR